MKQTVKYLLEGFKGEVKKQPEKLNFIGVEGYDVYNITAPFMDEGRRVIAGRVERRESEEANIRFFVEQEDGSWLLETTLPSFPFQDPFIQFIHGEVILGGVETFSLEHDPTKLGWKTVFYKGKTIRTLEKLITGPKGMKDIRLVGLSNNKIGVFTRPQHKSIAKGGRGKIGFQVIEGIDNLNETMLLSTPILDQFVDEEWGGVNAAYLLQNENIGVLGHIACFDASENRHYYSMVFEIDLKTSKVSEMKLLAKRAQFLQGAAKRPDLEDVIFSGGILFKNESTIELYVGVSDAEAQYITVGNPFSSIPVEE